ncbi:MAG: hypothetical protein P9L99_17045 [Candidatus Lernaella stagnicola]|nr:hypothetical protein [Candidatus Lernaella stagnicola]
MTTNKMMTAAFIVILVTVFGVGSALAGPAVWVGDYVWYDTNGNGLQDEPAENGINDVRVIAYRDYNCNGVIDGDDEIYDYDYTTEDEFGNPGYYYIPAFGGRCYVTFVDIDTIPDTYVPTTPDFLGAPVGDVDYLDFDFGFNEGQIEEPDFTCPKTIGFWKQQFKQGNSAKFTADELAVIVDTALDLTPVFATYDDFRYFLNARGNQGPAARAKKQFAAFTLNLAAFLTYEEGTFAAGLSFYTPLDLWLTDAETVGDAFYEVEDFILGGYDLGLANDLADAINNGDGVDVLCIEGGGNGGCRGGNGHGGNGHGGHGGHGHGHH